MNKKPKIIKEPKEAMLRKGGEIVTKEN